MIPILYTANEQDFTSNGIGRLSDCTSCLVTEERNGIYEVEFQYPMTGVHYNDIEVGSVIMVTHDEQKDRQPFIIYRRSAPINGVVTFNAHHISYKLSNVILKPMTATSTAAAFAMFETETLTDNPFTFWTDKTGSGSFEVAVPSSIKKVLGGTKGSILDVFGGGEYEWDGYTVKLYQHRGTDNGVTIRYGKNLTNIKAVYDTLDLYNAVIPYWADKDGTVVYGTVVYGGGGILQTDFWVDENDLYITDENNEKIAFKYAVSQVVPMDLSAEFEEQPTVSQLEDRAATILNSNEPWLPSENIKVDFVALWQTEEYADIAPLERVQLCDTVTVSYPALGVETTKKVIKVVWNALLDRYDSIELGNAQSSFADVIMADTEEKLADVPSTSMMDEAIEHATQLITGGMGGHIVFLYDADGKPTDMLVMDTEDVNTAVHVLRINVNGIGFSSTGVNGTYRSAWTLDGAFVADFITAGYLSCNRIQGGTLTLGGSENGNGILKTYDYHGNEIVNIDNTGLDVRYGTFRMSVGLEYYYDEEHHINSDIGVILRSDKNVEREAIRVLDAIGDRTHISYAPNSSFLNLPTGGAIRMIVGNELQFYDNTYNLAYYERLSKYGYNVSFSNDDGRITCGFGLFSSKPGLYVNTQSVGVYGLISPIILIEKNKFTLEIDEVSSSSAGSGISLTYGYMGNVWAVKSSTQNGAIAVQGSSSRRYKHFVTDKINEKLSAQKLYNLKMKQFVFKDDHPLQYADMAGQTLPGFIAEDVAEIYPAAVIHDAEGNIENWDERRIIPGMLTLIQEQKQQLDEQAEKIALLEKRLSKLEILLLNDGR